MVFILRIYLAHRNKISNESNLIVYSGQHHKGIKNKTHRQSQNGAKFLLILWTRIFITFGKVCSLPSFNSRKSMRTSVCHWNSSVHWRSDDKCCAQHNHISQTYIICHHYHMYNNTYRIWYYCLPHKSNLSLDKFTGGPWKAAPAIIITDSTVSWGFGEHR